MCDLSGLYLVSLISNNSKNGYSISNAHSRIKLDYNTDTVFPPMLVEVWCLLKHNTELPSVLKA